MDLRDKIDVARPFGPAVGEINVVNEFINNLNGYTESIILDKIKLTNQDAGKQLAGQVHQEFHIDKKFFDLKLNDYLSEIIYAYLWKSIGKINFSKFKEFKDKITIRYNSSWMVRQFENEYNPIHSHGGNISGVCYTMLPEKFGEKSQETKKKNPNGHIALVHGSEQFSSPALKVIEPEIGKFILFPNYLLHTVYPFKGPGERRSFSFNADVVIKN